MTSINTNDAYKRLLEEIKEAIISHKNVAVRSVNNAMIKLYWNIGKMIIEKQSDQGWGKSIVEHLAKDLQSDYNNTYGYSSQNLWYMRQFYLEYKDALNLQQLVGEIPWGQNILIFSKVKDKEKREYYLKATIEMGWSRNVLIRIA